MPGGLILKLTCAYLRDRPARTLSAVFCIAASTILVGWVIGSYEALLKSHDVYADRALGRYVLTVDPVSRAPDRHVSPKVIDLLNSESAVLCADPMWAQPVTVLMNPEEQAALSAEALSDDPSGRGENMIPTGKELMVLGTDASAPPFALLRGCWLNQAASNAEMPAVCLNASIAERLQLDVGSTFNAGRAPMSIPLRVVGIVDNPPRPITGRMTGSMQLPSPSIAGIYTTLADAEKIHKQPATVTFVGLVLKPGVDIHRFRYRLTPRIAAGDNPQQFMEDHDLEEDLDEQAAAGNMALQGYAVTGISMLLAWIMVFNTLNMGVSERVRQLALLRAVVLKRSQAAAMIILEGVLLAAVGLGLGLILAWCLLPLGNMLAGRMMHHDCQLGRLSLMMSVLAAFGGSLPATIIPAWRATRVRPLDAVARQATTGEGVIGMSWKIMLGGLFFLVLSPVLALWAMHLPERWMPFCMIAGLVCLCAGIILLAPVAVTAIDRLIGPLVARLLGLPPELLTRQLTGHLGRNVGAALALTVGLGLFLAIQTWSFSMLGAFVPGAWAPDAIVIAGPAGVTREQASQLAALAEVDRRRCAPLWVEQPRLRRDVTDSAKQASFIRQNNVTMIGIDPQRAFGGDRPLLNCRWTAGNTKTAIAKMHSGHACVVPDHFLSSTGLSVGDSFEVVPPEQPRRSCRYTIVGAVRLPGWHWLSKLAGLRMRTHRSAAMIFADAESVVEDFQLSNASHFWLRYTSPDVDERVLDASIKQVCAGAGSVSGLEVLPGSATEGMAKSSRTQFPKLVSKLRTRRALLGAAGRWIWASSVLPLVVLLIAGVGLMNLMMTSVRTRYWEFGVLRSVGLTHWCIVRLIIAEGLLIGCVACLLSLVFGLVAGWSSTGVVSQMTFFGGMRTEWVVPYTGIGVGWLVLLSLMLLISAWPALRAGRQRPLDLLQEGMTQF